MSLQTLEAQISMKRSAGASGDSGGFTAVASTGRVDRDGEVLRPGCFAPLPASIPCHLDHELTTEKLVARGRPYYDGPKLMIDATFAAKPLAQEIRKMVADGTITAVSVVFRGIDWRMVDGVRTCFKGDLLAADLCTIPSNSDAMVLSSRSVTGRRLSSDQVMVKARAEIAKLLADAELALTRVQTGRGRGPVRRYVDAELRSLAEPPRPLEDEPVTFEGRRLTRHLYTY